MSYKLPHVPKLLKAHRGIGYIALVILEVFHQIAEFCILL